MNFSGDFLWICFAFFLGKTTGGKNPPKNPWQNSHQNLGASRPKSTLQGSGLEKFPIKVRRGRGQTSQYSYLVVILLNRVPQQLDLLVADSCTSIIGKQHDAGTTGETSMRQQLHETTSCHPFAVWTDDGLRGSRQSNNDASPQRIFSLTELGTCMCVCVCVCVCARSFVCVSVCVSAHVCRGVLTHNKLLQWSSSQEGFWSQGAHRHLVGEAVNMWRDIKEQNGGGLWEDWKEEAAYSRGCSRTELQASCAIDSVV